MIAPARGSLLSIEHLSTRDIGSILQLSRRMKLGHTRPLLRGKRVGLLFYETSTRTRASFEVAAKVLGAITIHIQATGSSIEKGESLIDTGATLHAIGVDILVVRHPSSGAPHLLAQHLAIPIINAGDGMHEHPSQALLDAYTILRHKKKIAGLRIAIIGDIFHSRVARSNIHLLSKLGGNMILCGPPELLPELATTLAPNLQIVRHVEDAVRDADVVMLLRVQKERLDGLKVHIYDYITRFQMTPARLKLAKRDAILMHPGPAIRGLELEGDLADGPQSVIREEVRNGVPVRMAILARAAGTAR
jgi:aspartate carbamoyltransferase catalytic subunit